MHEFDPGTQKIIDDFDVHAKKRAAELLAHTANEQRERAFCLGYKAGVVDLGKVHCAQPVDDGALLAAVFKAACAWRDADAQGLSNSGVLEEKLRLIDAVDAARAAGKEGSS